MTSIDLLKFKLPDFLVDYFEIFSAVNSEEHLHLYYEVNAQPPMHYDAVE